jgi:hypothetical protein
MICAWHVTIHTYMWRLNGVEVASAHYVRATPPHDTCSLLSPFTRFVDETVKERKKEVKEASSIARVWRLHSRSPPHLLCRFGGIGSRCADVVSSTTATACGEGPGMAGVGWAFQDRCFGCYAAFLVFFEARNSRLTWGTRAYAKVIGPTPSLLHGITQVGWRHEATRPAWSTVKGYKM